MAVRINYIATHSLHCLEELVTKIWDCQWPVFFMHISVLGKGCFLWCDD